MKKRIINGVKNGQSLCEYKVAHSAFTAGFLKCVRQCESAERTAERALEKKNSRSLRRYLIYEVQGKKGVFRR